MSSHGMLLCADRGDVHEESLEGQALPPVSASSATVVEHEQRAGQINFNALVEFAMRTGGVALTPAKPSGQSILAGGVSAR